MARSSGRPPSVALSALRKAIARSRPSNWNASREISPCRRASPAEIRGEFAAISTKLPGVHFSEYMTKLAASLDSFSLIRSIRHDQGNHGAGNPGPQRQEEQVLRTHPAAQAPFGETA